MIYLVELFDHVLENIIYESIPWQLKKKIGYKSHHQVQVYLCRKEIQIALFFYPKMQV